MSVITVLFVGAIAASFVQSVSGFGYAIITMSILPFFLPVQTAAMIQLATSSLTLLWIVVKYRSYIRWKIIPLPLLANFIFTRIGILIQDNAQDRVLRHLLGGVLILMAVWFLFSKGKTRIAKMSVSGFAAGSLGGLLTGLMGIGGPPMAIYFLEATKSKEEYTATFQVYALIGALYAFGNYVLMGRVTTEVFRYCLPAYMGLAVGTAAGLKLFDRLDGMSVRKAVYFVMVGIGLIMLLGG